MRVVDINPSVDFDVAFASAREAGADQFNWRDKRYTTIRSDDHKPPIQVVTRTSEQDV